MDTKLILCFLLIVVQVWSFENITDDHIINTKLGPVRGVVVPERGFRFFLGIPYAEPPVGPLRWEPTVPKKPWAPKVLDATRLGFKCPQTVALFPPADENEDCLFINLWLPYKHSQQTKKAAPYPVMVWIHGGGFDLGSGGDPFFWGDYYANSTETILVSFNYRLGAFGFLYNPEAKIMGNMGMLDQSAALKWVQSNIADFGGDPNRVTIFGESAGGISVAIHLVSPLTFEHKYFSRAIMESNAPAMQIRTPEEMQVHAETFSLWVGCEPSDRNCFNGLGVQHVVIAEFITVDIPLHPGLALTELPWEPVIDPKVITGDPLFLYQQGKFYDVPVIFGNNRNETALFGYNLIDALHMDDIIPAQLYEAGVELFFGNKSQEILARYPASSENCMWPALQLTNDFLFICPTRNMVASASKRVEARAYMFLHESLHHDPAIPWPIECWQNGVVCHATELTYVFHSIGFFAGFPRTKAEDQLSWDMLRLWADFAHGTLTESQWPTFNTTTKTYLGLDIPIHPIHSYDGSICDFWDKLGYNW